MIAFNAIHAEITWTLSDDGTLTIKGTNMPDYYTLWGGWDSSPWSNQRDKVKKVIIEKGVTNIGGSAFRDCSSLTSVTIPNSVTNIGDYAFSGCTGLTSITIPNSVTSIGGAAFSGCSGLTSITIPNSVTSIGASAFYRCKGLTSITIPNSVTSIGKNAFDGTDWYNNQPDGLLYTGQVLYKYKGTMPTNTKIVIKEGIKGIGDSAFDGCSGLTSITIPNSMTSIGKEAFVGCSSLNSVTIPNSVTSIGDGAFYQCSGLTSITIPNSVTSIGVSAFFGCSGLTSITIPNSVTGIGEYTFRNCSGLTSVTIGNSVTSIGDYAFNGCQLQTLTIGTNVTSISSNVYGDKSKPQKVIWLPNTPPSGYANASGNINYVSNEKYSNIPNTKLYKYLSSMFEVDGIRYVPVSPSERTCDAIDCNYEKTIEDIKINDVVYYKNIGMNVLNINPYTCYGNEFVMTLHINNSGKIDEWAFGGCKNITSVTFGNKVTSIGDYAFNGCMAIKDIKIPDCITSVGICGFGGCFALQSVAIGNGLTSVGDYSFSGCSRLQKVVLGGSPVSIGNYAFNNCSALAELNIGKKVKKIGKYTFANCSSLTKISIPETTTSIGDYAFSGCKNLADVTIEDRTQSISLGSNGSSPLFADCPISSVYLGGKLSYNTSSNSGYSPFYRNKNLQSVVIADTEEQIYDNEFYGCTNLKSVKIGDGVKSIGNWAFSGCANLESFSFGKSMQSIGKEAFSDCTKMTSITSYAAKAPECGSQALDDIDKWSCVLSVPYSCLASYQNADQWKEFFFIQEAEVDEKLVAAKAAFDKYKSEQKTIIEALAKEYDSDAVKAIINKAISDINSMEYDVKISLDENKAKILSFVNSIDEAVQKQRAEDHKATGIEELEIAEKVNIYDLNGRKITSSVLKSGLYIRNGKKVVVK